MNKNYLNIFVIIICFLFTIICFNNSTILSLSMLDSFKIFITNVFPFLFNMMIINQLLIKFNLPYYLNKLIPSPYIYIFLLSLISGCPTNAIIIKELLDNKTITTKEGSLALAFSTLNNPLFLFHYFNLIFDYKTTIKLFIIIYLLNIITLLWILIKYNTHHIKIQKVKYKLSKEIPLAITNTFSKLLQICAIIIFFKLLSDLLLPSSNITSSFFKGIIEITQGLNSLCILNASNKIKELLALVILIFSGFSIHIQISNILEDYPINYKYFYLSRIIQIIFAILLFFST